MTHPNAGKVFLVTGGAGFIGSHVTHTLLKQGAEVIVVDDFNDFYDPTIKESNLASLEHHPRFRLYREDIREWLGLKNIFEHHGKGLRNGGIIHLAARAGVRPSLKEPRLYLETNVTGTLNLLELAQEYQVKKFIFASSSSVYGDNPQQVPFQEGQDISRPISPYAATKAMGENLLYTYSHLYDLQVVVLRFFTVYGAGQRPDLAIHQFTRLIEAGQPITLFGDGTTQRDYTYIDDIIQGIMGALQYDATPFEIFNLGESQTTSLSNLVQILENSLEKTATIHRLPLQPGDVTVTYADISKARRLLGYNPQTSLHEGIPRFVAWYRNWKEYRALVPV